MSRHIKYQPSPELIRTYLSLIGADKKLYDNASIEQISEEGVRNIVGLYDESLSEDIAYLPESSWSIANRLGTILEGASTSKGHLDIQNVVYQHAVLSIMEIITNLNLIEEDLEDYILLFERINSIYNVVLDQMLNLSQDEVIKLHGMMFKLDIKLVRELFEKQRFQVMACLLFLATRYDENIKDYEMFKEGTAEIDYGKMFGLVSKNLSLSNLFNFKSEEKDNEPEKKDVPKLSNKTSSFQERHPEVFSGDRQSFINAYQNRGTR